MIESLTLRNFQCHDKIRIDFDPHITVLTGSSDTGKSSIIRSLRWIAFNRPGGNSFIKSGTEKTTVTLELDGNEIRRSKGKENTYHLNGKPLKAFGSDVPEGVSRLLNLSEVNFQQQHDSPFWFSLSAGEVSRQLNQIINLGVIDSTLANLNSRLRKTSAEIDVTSQRLTAAQESRNSVADAADMDEELQAVEGLASTLEETIAKRDLLHDSIENVLRYDQIAKNAAERHSDSLETVEKGERWQLAESDRSNLAGLIQKAEKFQAVAGRKIPDLKPVELLWEKWQGLKRKYRELETETIKGESFQKVLTKKRAAIIEAEKQLKQNFPKVCPLCETIQ